MLRNTRCSPLAVPLQPTRMENSVRETAKHLPLLTIDAGPRDGDRWKERLKQEYKVSPDQGFQQISVASLYQTFWFSEGTKEVPKNTSSKISRLRFTENCDAKTWSPCPVLWGLCEPTPGKLPSRKGGKRVERVAGKGAGFVSLCAWSSSVPHFILGCVLCLIGSHWVCGTVCLRFHPRPSFNSWNTTSSTARPRLAKEVVHLLTPTFSSSMPPPGASLSKILTAWPSNEVFAPGMTRLWPRFCHQNASRWAESVLGSSHSPHF